MKRRIISIIVALSMILGLFPVLASTVAADEDEDNPTVSSPYPDGYVKPEHEEGKINMSGYYTVANDGQLMANLEWTYPFTNPLTGIGVDPGRPYRYRMWQSKKLADGTWTAWDTRSPVDVDKADGQVRVLNVAPNSEATAYLKNWMAMPATDYDGTQTTVGRGIIKVTAVTLDDYNARADTILKTDPDTGELTTEYQYSVIMFGTYDANNSKDLTAASRDVTEAFSRAGGGLMFGHDTLTGWTGVGVRTYFSRFAQSDFLDIRLDNEATTYLSTNVKVVNTGFLTSRPWDLEGKTLTIPQTHMLGQKVLASSPATVWMQFSDAAGNVSGGIMQGSGQTVPNYYLVTNGATAMIQTGHTSGAATIDEAKVFANTLLYLAQSTVTTTARDSSFIDEAAPEKPSGTVSSVVPASDLTNYVAKIQLSGGTDRGTDYSYKIQGVPQATLEGDSSYVEKWTSTATDPTDESLFHLTALSGLKGYYVKAVNTNPNAITATTAEARANLIPVEGDVTEYTTPALVPGGDYYVHAFAVDYAGNVSEDMVIPISVSGRIATFNNNDGTDGSEQTLLTSIGTLATMPENLTREGYEFIGWYTSPDGSGEQVTKETVFSEEEYPDGVSLYAKWIEVYTVTVGSRGEGSVTLSGPDREKNPFRKGSDVTVTCTPEENYRVAGIWIDDVYKPIADGDDASGIITETISNIGEEHFVMVEFAPKETDDTPDGTVKEQYYSIETSLSGGPGSVITPGTRILYKDDVSEAYEVKWTAADGYAVKTVTVDGIVRNDLLGKTSVKFENIREDHTVDVSFVPESEVNNKDKFRVETKIIGGPGSISPSKDFADGANYTVKAVVGDIQNYEITSITVYDSNGAKVDSFAVNTADGTAALTNISEDYYVEAVLSPKKQAGTVTIAEEDLMRVDTEIRGGGTISESKTVKRGDSCSVTWTVENGWYVREVIIDGDRIFYPEQIHEETEIQLFALENSELENSERLFENIDENHSVLVILEQEDAEQEDGVFSVQTKMTGDAGASLTAGNSALPEGSDYEVSWSVLYNYAVTDVMINGVSHPELLTENSYTFADIAENYVFELVVAKILNVDTDGDGKPDVNIDDDGDGKPDVNIDTDGDGKPDVNIDTDGDGKPDLNVDDDDDGKPDVNIVDKDGDGEPDKGIDPKNPPKPDVNVDTDGDGEPDLNVDDDDDGKPDVNIVDKDGDGEPDKDIDPENPPKPDVNVDTDGDGKPDVNIDTDDDGKPDVNIVDKDGDGEPDKDIDNSDPENPVLPDVNVDTDGDNDPDVNIDDNGDGKPDRNIVDKDKDGEPDKGIDLKAEPSVTPDVNVDTDGDGKPDVNVDTDGDGKPDVNIDTDDDGKPDVNIVDKDGDGEPDKGIDNSDPENPVLPDVNVDTDGDGKPDINIDTDDDGKPDINIEDEDRDGKPDKDVKPSPETLPDVNVDTDGDSKPDVNVDTDGDGKPDMNIEDKDDDGLPDLNIKVPSDKKADVNVDTDGDGKPDVNIDTDGDGKPDINIVDKDKDGKPDKDVQIPSDIKPDVNVDTDGDGKPDVNIDTDGDGIPDLNIDADGDGKPDVNVDTDKDGKPNINIDTKGDGKADTNIDTDGDGKADINIDTTGNGIADTNIDTDGDGKADINIDTDGDGKADSNLDTDGDGIADTNLLNPPPTSDIFGTVYCIIAMLSAAAGILAVSVIYRKKCR